jgi:outer membrane murein-binding lipoprotein Lpp
MTRQFRMLLAAAAILSPLALAGMASPAEAATTRTQVATPHAQVHRTAATRRQPAQRTVRHRKPRATTAPAASPAH